MANQGKHGVWSYFIKTFIITATKTNRTNVICEKKQLTKDIRWRSTQYNNDRLSCPVNCNMIAALVNRQHEKGYDVMNQFERRVLPLPSLSLCAPHCHFYFSQCTHSFSLSLNLPFKYFRFFF